jgi:uncharacterized protein YqhQ
MKTHPADLLCRCAIVCAGVAHVWNSSAVRVFVCFVPCVCGGFVFVLLGVFLFRSVRNPCSAHPSLSIVSALVQLCLQLFRALGASVCAGDVSRVAEDNGNKHALLLVLSA